MRLRKFKQPKNPKAPEGQSDSEILARLDLMARYLGDMAATILDQRDTIKIAIDELRAQIEDIKKENRDSAVILDAE